EEEDNLQMLVVAVQEQLRKANFEDFSNMMDSCRHEDVLGTGFLPLQELHNTCKRFNVPAKQDLLVAIVEKVERNHRDEANYEQFLKLLNWRDSPVTTQKFVPAAAPDPKSTQRTGPQEFVRLVSYKDLLQSLLEVE
ncbi:EF-hand domain-containing family member C2-like, partial [Oculina patagonica]